jgi:hypothetical protein
MIRKPEYESWSAGGGMSYLVTDDSGFASYLRRTIGGGAIYELGGRAIRWQFLLKTAEVAPIVRQYVDQNAGVSQGPQSTFSAIDSKQLTGADFSNLPADERSTDAMRKWTPPHRAHRKSHSTGHLNIGAS